MKRLIILTVCIAVLGAVAWGAGAMIHRTAAERWLAARNAEGWVAAAGDIRVRGFPTRFETRFADLSLADPVTGLAVDAPALVLDQQLFRLDRLAVRLPAVLVLATPEETLTLSHDGLSAALDVQPSNRFALDALDGGLSDLTLTSSLDWSLSLGTAEVAIRRTAGMTYDVAILGREMRPPDPVRASLDPAALLPETIATTDVALTVSFDRAWDLDAISVARPQPTQIVIDSISATWGDLLFRCSGTLDVTPGGVAEGALEVRAENWRAMMDLALNSGLVPPQFEGSAMTMLEALAGLSGEPENIDATLTFTNGRIFLGPIPLGPAPSLRLR